MRIEIFPHAPREDADELKLRLPIGEFGQIWHVEANIDELSGRRSRVVQIQLYVVC